MGIISTFFGENSSSSGCSDKNSYCSYLVIFVALQVIAQYPIWVSSVPVLSDYPNHLARMHILHESGRSVFLNNFYQIHWDIIPNLAMDLFVPPLVNWFGLDVAGKIFLALILLLISSGTIALYYVLQGRLTLWPFVIFLFLYNWVFVYGVINYLFAVGVMLWTVAGWIACRSASILFRTLLLSLSFVVLFFLHLTAVFLFILIVFSYELQGVVYGEKYCSLKRMLALFMPLIFPALLFYGGPLTQSSWPLFDFRIDNIFTYCRSLFVQKMLAPILPFWNYNKWFDVFSCIVFFVVIINGFLSKNIVIEKSMKYVLLSIGFFYLLMPKVLFGSAMADYRLVPAWAFLSIASTDLKAVVQIRKIVLSIFLFLFLIRIVVIEKYWMAQEDIVENYRKILFQMQPGSRLFVAFPVMSYSGAIGEFIMQLPCLAIVSRSIFVPTLYAMNSAQPVVFTPKYQMIKASAGGGFFDKNKMPNWRVIEKNYDYALVAGGDHFKPAPSQGFYLFASGYNFKVYKIKKTE